MRESTRTRVRLTPVLLLLIASPAVSGASVNRSIDVADGEVVDDDLSSVNGSIEIAESVSCGSLGAPSGVSESPV